VSGPLCGNLLLVRVTPKASRNEVSGLHVDAAGTMSLAVKVTAVPDKGLANAAVIKTKSTFSLVKGHTDRNKTFQITGPTHTIEAFIASLGQLGISHGKDH
jgi:uncharacterized protein YggU (UPF0235/DUF167 family)